MRRYIATVAVLLLLFTEIASTMGISLEIIVSTEIASTMAVPLEIIVSQRKSVRNYTDELITSQQLLTLLHNAYGYSGDNRVLPRIGDAHSLVLYAINSSGTYIYTPETNSLSVWSSTVTKETILPYLNQAWSWESNTDLFVFWDSTKMGNQYFASAEAGCLVQNFHLTAASLGIGTCCLVGFNEDLRTELGLPSTMVPLLMMSAGIPLPSYSYDPNATPAISSMTDNLPVVQNSAKTFEEALSDINFTETWVAEELSLQEQSQLLWAAYGYSSTGHRTTPSAEGWYPLIVYMLNATGTFRYLPEDHCVLEVQEGDKRSIIADIYGNQLWAADAPTIFLLLYDSSFNTKYAEPGGFDYMVEIDAGCVVQQILLESSALGLGANVVSKGFEYWNGTSAQTLRNTLNIPSSIVPLHIIPVGHVIPTATPTPTPSSPPSSSPTPPEFLLILATLGIIAAVGFGIVILKRRSKNSNKFDKQQ